MKKNKLYTIKNWFINKIMINYSYDQNLTGQLFIIGFLSLFLMFLLLSCIF